jgi:hypothetical protein
VLDETDDSDDDEFDLVGGLRADMSILGASSLLIAPNPFCPLVPHVDLGKLWNGGGATAVIWTELR